MIQVFGDFIEELPLEQDFLEISFTSSSRTSRKRWSNNRLAAYFVADYFSNLLQIDENDPPGEERLNEAKNAVSYVGNELLENAIKFHEKSQSELVKFGLHLLEGAEEITVIIFAKNSITIPNFEKLQSFIKELLAADTNELYIQQIEKTSEDENSETSGLGLLTIINDYSAKLCWKFESASSNPQIINVTTMAQITV
jgi:hypothetical protein